MPRTKSFCEAEVLEKALRLFHRDGYEGVSVQDLVSHLGISRSSLYETYGSKEELFVAVIKSYRDQNAKAALHQLRAENNGYDTIRNFFQDSLLLACNDPDKKGCLMINSIIDASKDVVPSAGQIIRDNKAEFVDALAKVIQSGQRQKTINKDLEPDSTAEMLFALHSGLIAQSRIENDPDKLAKALEIGLSILK